MTASDCVTRLQQLVRRLSRYDFILVLIPAAFAIALGFTVFAPVPRHLGLGSASVIATLFVLDALFLNPPPGSTGTRGLG